jgi:hypothetical protein
LYTSAEAQRALLVSGSSGDIGVPVQIVGASCDAVSLSISGSEPIVVTSLSGSNPERLQSTLCDIAEASSTPVSEGRNAMLLKHLNRLISRAQ